MQCDLFATDKDKIAATIASWKKRKMQIIALDQKGFDLHMGGKKLESLVNGTLKHFLTEQEVKDVWYECSIPLFLQQGITDASTPQLPSGMSFTTVLGCLGSGACLAYVLKRLGLDINKKGGQWDAMLWGDDALIAFTVPREESLINDLYKEIGMEIEFEEKVKFLGFIYDDDYMSYPLYRIFQGLFPEKLAHPDLFGLGIVAKFTLYKLANRQLVAERFCYWLEQIHGPRYKFDPRAIFEPWESNIYVRRGLDRAAKVAGEMAYLDEILYSMGRDFDEADDYALFGVPEEARSWVSPERMEQDLPQKIRMELSEDPFSVLRRLATETITEADLDAQGEVILDEADA